MTVQELEERKEKVLIKIEKKQNTITKKWDWIAKKQNELRDLTEEYDIRWKENEIDELRNDIDRLNKEIIEARDTVKGYDEKISAEKAKEEIIQNRIPEALKDYQNQLVDSWNAWDKSRREYIWNQYQELGYCEFYQKFNGTDRDLLHKTDEEIVKDNEKAAKYLILDFYNRVYKITGEITDWSYLHIDNGNENTSCGAVINGYVTGKNGTAKVESIEAGGYNIQRLHVRVLVRKVN